MRVLHLNSYDSHGGAEIVFMATVKGLNNLVDVKNYSGYVKTTSNADLPDIKFVSWEEKGKYFGWLSYIFSFGNYLKLKNFLQETKVDIIHIHGIYSSLSPSLLLAIRFAKRKCKFKVVHTTHDYQVVCPNSSLYNYNTNTICTYCVGKKFKSGIFLKSCDRRGKIYSLIKAVRGVVSNNLLMHKKAVDYYITPSNFVMEKLLEDGIKREECFLLRNPLTSIPSVQNSEKTDSICYFGRLSAEKNVQFIVKAFEAWKIANPAGKQFKLNIIGQGEEKENIESLILSSPFRDDIVLLGFMEHGKLADFLRTQKVFVMASYWFEVAPMSILEALSLNLIPLVPDLGGMKETIEEFGVGEVYISGDIDNFIEKIDTIIVKCDNGTTVKQSLINSLSLENYTLKLVDFYKRILA